MAKINGIRKIVEKLSDLIFNENTDNETLHHEDVDIPDNNDNEDDEDTSGFDENREDDEDVDLLSEDSEFME
jgi:hypothetical protein